MLRITKNTNPPRSNLGGYVNNNKNSHNININDHHIPKSSLLNSSYQFCSYHSYTNTRVFPSGDTLHNSASLQNKNLKKITQNKNFDRLLSHEKTHNFSSSFHRYYSSYIPKPTFGTLDQLIQLAKKMEEMDHMVWQPEQVDRVVRNILEEEPSWPHDPEICSTVASMPISKSFAQELWSYCKTQVKYVDLDLAVSLIQSIGFDHDLVPEILDRCEPRESEDIHLEVWSVLLDQSIHNYNPEQAIKIMEFMLLRSVRPEEGVLHKLSEVLVASNSVRLAIDVLKAILNKQLPFYRSVVVHISTLLVQRSIEELEELLIYTINHHVFKPGDIELIGNNILRGTKKHGPDAVVKKMEHLQQQTNNRYIPSKFSHLQVIRAFTPGDEQAALGAYNYFCRLLTDENIDLNLKLFDAVLEKLVKINFPSTLKLFHLAPYRLIRQPTILARALTFCGQTDQAETGYRMLHNHIANGGALNKGLRFAAMNMCVMHRRSLRLMPKVIEMLFGWDTHYSRLHGLCVSLLRRCRRMKIPHCLEVYNKLVRLGTVLPNPSVVAIVLQALLVTAPEKASVLWQDSLNKQKVEPDTECYSLYAACIDAADKEQRIEDAPDRIYSLFQKIRKTHLQPQNQFVRAIICVLARHNDPRIEEVIDSTQQGYLPTPADEESRMAIQKAQAQNIVRSPPQKLQPLQLFS